MKHGTRETHENYLGFVLVGRWAAMPMCVVGVVVPICHGVILPR